MGKSVTGIRLAAAALLLLAPLLSHAAGLGSLTVTSPLGQPLSAEIEIISLQQGEEDSLSARLASPEAFRQAGMEMSSSLIGLQLTIDRRAGKPYIRLRSTQPINDPFLDVLIELQWATGRLVRQYTFLLDPAEYKKPAPGAEPAPAPRIESRPITAAPVVPAGAPARTHEVKKGDTLGAIARANRPEGVTLNQMLIALYRTNQDAFINGNINLVRAGRILAIPDRDAINPMDQNEDNAVVKTHMAEFAAYRQKLAGIVAASPAPAAAPAREVTGRIGPKPEATASAEQKDQLKLSKADSANPGTPAAKDTREDHRVARERALNEQQSRIGDLGKNVTDLQKLVELKNQQLAELEKNSGAKPEAPKAAEPAKTAEAPKKAPEAAPAPDAKKARAPTKAPPPALEPDLLDEFTNFVSDPVSGGGLAGVLLLLVGYGAWAWKKKKSGQNSSQFQDSVLGAASGGAAGSVFGAGAAPGATAATPAASISEAPSVREAPSAVAAESDPLDPVADADVYMAYGRNAQAEEILKEALAKDSSRVPVHVKLLENYASQRDAKAFEQAARKVKSLTGSSGPDWDKAMALGHSFDPSNGLYGTGAATSPRAEAAAPATAAPALEFRKSKAASSSGLDFDLDKTYEGGLNLGAAQKADAAKPAADPDAIVSMDFDLNLDLGGDKPAEVKASPSSGDLDIGSLSLDIGGASGAAGAAGGDAKWQELATKLDLARELLNEVANDGDARQQAQAKQMLGNLG